MAKIIRRDYDDNGAKTLWTIVVAIFALLLLLLTLGIVALRIGNTLPEGKDIFFITPKNPGSHVEDKDGVWEKLEKVDIFKSEYVNGQNQTTVVSQKGDDVFAPGAQTEYSFCMYNDGNMALSYELGFSFTLKIAGLETDVESFPLSIRLSDTNGKYIVGSETQWVTLQADEIGAYKSILGANSYEQFNLEIEWKFEGNDQLDTFFGNVAEESTVQLSFNIHTYAEEHYNPAEQGGVIVNEGVDYNEYEFGGMIRWEWFLILLALLAICVLYLVVFRS